MLKYFLSWFPLVALAIGNGVARELVFKNTLGDFREHQLSTLTLMLLLLGYGLAIRQWLHIQHVQEALKCSLVWVSFTIVFEFGFGYWVAHKTMGELLAQYNLLAGNLWALVLLFIAALPFILQQISK